MLILKDLLLCSASPSTTLITWAALELVVYSGTVHTGDKTFVIKNDGSRAMSQVKQLFTLTTFTIRSAARLTQVILQQSLALII